MAEPNPPPVEAVLARAARAVRVPDADVLAAAVTERLRSRQPAVTPGRVPFGHRAWRRRGALVAGVVVLSVLGASLVPPVRSAVAGLLGVDGVRITRANTAITVPARPPPSASTSTTAQIDPVAALHLGQPTSLQQAARLVGFPMRIPTVDGYQHPDAVYVGTPPPGGMASMIYLPTASRPAVAARGVAALLSEFRGRLEAGLFQKLVGNGTNVEAVRVGAVGGYWLSGEPHEFFYVAPDGTVDTETIRLATNTLLWSAAGITYRLESALSRDTAITLAVSMR